jgi:S1-C subfamily serine protease
MLMRRCLGGLAVLLACVAAAPAQDDPLKQALALEESIQKVIAKAEPSIACILVSRSDGYKRFDPMFGRREPGQLGGFQPPHNAGGFHRDMQLEELARRLDLTDPKAVPDSYGSGVVIDRSGLILTNFHVVHDATKIFVRLPGQPGWYADIYAADERSDLAVLKLIDPRGRVQGLSALPIGDADNAKKGQFVIALANPFAAGFRDGSPSVSWGMLSNIHRRVPGEINDTNNRRPRLHYYAFLLQTDFRLNLGCSGGALLDLKGNWIGLTTAQAALAGGETSGGFALPLDRRMKRIIEVLRQGKEMEYGFLGITLQQNGAIGVTSNGPAEKAGLRTPIRIDSIDGYPIVEQDDLLLNVAVCPAGTETTMRVFQDGRLRTVSVKVAKSWWPASGPVIAANRPAPVFGLRVDWTSTLMRGAFPGSEIAPGVVVREVAPDSPAARAGLRAETDIIVEVNGNAVNSPSEFYEAAAKAGHPLELTLADSERKVKLP